MRRWAILVSILLAPSVVSAQSYARRSVRPGEVTGLEMAIDGSLQARPGGRVRWFVTLYEVLRRRDLRPAPNATLRVTTSADRAAPVAEVTTDARGRAALEIPVPADGAPSVRVEAVSPRGVQRVFSVGLTAEPRYAIELWVDRDAVAPGATVAVFGRVLDRVRGGPAPGVDVVISAQGAGPLAPREERTTDASGVFAASVTVREAGAVRVLARALNERGETLTTATQSLTVAAPDVSPLWVEATPAERVVAPGVIVPVRVRVRTPDGEPVAGAEVDFEDARREEDERAPRTDADGVASLAWRLPSVSGEGVRPASRSVRVVDPRRGTVVAPVTVRVSRAPMRVGFAVDGGALAPGLDGRVIVRAVRPDGAPIAGRDLTLEAPRLGGRLTASTGADGVAVFRGPVADQSTPDGCGGPTAAEATLAIGGHRERLCLPVDPDATLTVEAAPVTRDGAVAFEVSRRRVVSRAAVEVMALAASPSGWIPVARATLDPAERRGALTIPPDASGRIWLRARPILDGGRAARGGGRLIFHGPDAAALSVRADEHEARIDEDGDGTTAVFAMAPGRADALEAIFEARLGEVGAAIARGRSEAWTEGLLASHTPRDVAASVAMREGQLVIQPLPQEPVHEGLLRDPWRTRARFVRGRIGRMMRAVEDYVSAHVPDDLAEVAAPRGRSLRFNRAVLDAALASAGLGDETAASLDGEPVDIDALSAMDPAFDYDHVARRITRERLFRVYVLLRQLVDDRQLDRPWARRGDPALFIPSLLEVQDVSWSTEWPERGHLFDGWGRPFVLRRARGRSRFTFLEPVPGWELVSAGPDGRAGTGDDLVDPFERVLPTGGLYADAVGEDVLLARLQGVALGRATAEALVGAFEVPAPQYSPSDAPPPVDGGFSTLPEPLDEDDAPPPVPPQVDPIGGVGEARSWELPPERRVYAALAVRFGRDGALRSARDRFVAGAPWVARLEMPEAVRPGERLRIPLTLVRLADAPPPDVEVSVDGDAIEAHLDGRDIVLEARRAGLAALRVRVRSGDRPVGDFARTIRIVPSGGLRARHVGALGAEASAAIHAPAGVTPWRALAVVGAPRALVSDPIFDATRERHPAVVAWARAMAGEAIDPEVMVGSLRSHDGSLESACALVAWLVADEDGAPVSATARALADSVPADLSGRAAILAALAPAAPGGPSGGDDPIEALLASLRQDGWRALASATDRPAVMARVAAALLLADRRDAPGRALLERATARLETDAHGRRWVPGDPAHPGDGWIGTLALAIAARQAGDDALADELGARALDRLYLTPRLGAEGAFWAAAASVYGALGVDAPEHVELTVDGIARTVDLEDGVAVVPVPSTTEVSVRSDRPVWLRLESRYLVPYRTAEEGPLRATIEGTPGRRGERAGLELALTNATGDEAQSPVVEITLPGAARLDEDGRAAIERAGAVRRVEAPDPAGVIRVHLAPLAGRGTHRVPLPVRWIASGRTRGLATAAYDAAAPRVIATTGERTLTIEEAR